jgi:hypothetical protein
MGHSNHDGPGLGLMLGLVFVLLFSVYASVASAQPMSDTAALTYNRLAMQDR